MTACSRSFIVDSQRQKNEVDVHAANGGQVQQNDWRAMQVDVLGDFGLVVEPDQPQVESLNGSNQPAAKVDFNLEVRPIAAWLNCVVLRGVTMAHTIKGNMFTTFHFNGDFSGDVEIVRFEGTSQEEKMRVPMSALEVLFAEKIRRKRIERLEQMTDEQVIADAIGL